MWLVHGYLRLSVLCTRRLVFMLLTKKHSRQMWEQMRAGSCFHSTRAKTAGNLQVIDLKVRVLGLSRTGADKNVQELPHVICRHQERGGVRFPALHPKR